MSRIMVLDPTARRDDDIVSPGPDAGVLAGKRIGFRVDQIWRAWDWVSELWAGNSDILAFLWPLRRRGRAHGAPI